MLLLAVVSIFPMANAAKEKVKNVLTAQKAVVVGSTIMSLGQSLARSYSSLNVKLSSESPSRIPFNPGDRANYVINFAGFLNGTMDMYVGQETADGIWLVQDIDLMIQKQKVETLFDKNTGQVKKVLVDGKEQSLETGGEPPEIVESKPDTVEVPAGKFECSYLKLHDKKQNSDLEFWVNAEIIPMLGLIKQVAQSQFGPVVIELKSFEKR